MRRSSLYAIVLVCFIVGANLVAPHPRPALATAHSGNESPTSSNSPTATNAVGLPGDCIGVTPGGGGVPACCISGYVWMDNQIIRGATVTVTSANGSIELITDNLPDSTQPYYRTSLTAAPLNVSVGQTITITARYSSHERTITHVVESGGQQVDIVLSKNYATDYMFERQIWYPSPDGTFNSPRNIAINDNLGLVYIVDWGNNRVEVFTKSGLFIRRWGTLGNFVGEFSNPKDIAIDSFNNVYVLDSGNNRIQKFDAEGNFINSWGSKGKNNGQFDFPSNIAVDPLGYVYVLEIYGRVQIFTSTGQWVTSWQSTTQPFLASQGIAVDGTNVFIVNDSKKILKFSKNGIFIKTIMDNIDLNAVIDLSFNSNSLYLLCSKCNKIYKYTDDVFVRDYLISGSSIDIDANNDLYIIDRVIKKYSDNGVFISSFGSTETGNNQIIIPRGITVDSNNNLYVVDSHDDNIKKYSSNGTWVKNWGSLGAGNGQFNDAQDIQVDSSNNVYVVDTGNDRIQKFTSEGVWLNSWGSTGVGNGHFDYPYGITVDTNGDFYVTEGYTQAQSNHRVQKFDQFGNFIRSWGSIGMGNGQFQAPQGIGIGNDGFVYVVDNGSLLNPGTARIQKFTKDGQWLQSWGDYSTLGNVHSLTIDNANNLLLPSWTYSGVKIFTNSGTLISRFGTYGYSKGDIPFPFGITQDSNGHVYVAEAFRGIIQIFRPMTYTQPIATINWLNKRSLIQGQDSLTIKGYGQDSDEDGNPTAFTYRWYANNSLVGYGKNFTVSASQLPIGAVTIGLEVVDDEGQISSRVSTLVDVSPPPQTAWTFMLYLVADSQADGNELLDAMDTGFGNGLLARLQRQQQTTPNPNVNVVVQIDAYGSGNTRRLILQPNGTFQEVLRTEKAMDDPATLEDFVRWTKQNKPAQQYYLAIASHGNGYQGVAWDDTSGPVQYLRMSELRQALTNASSSGADPIDVLHLDACSMGLLDVAYELRQNVRYLVVSQNLGWSFFLQDKYRAVTGANTTPRQLGQTIVTLYADYAEQESASVNSQDQYPYTVSLIDVGRSQPTVQALDALSAELGGFASYSNNNRGILRTIRDASQKFDSQNFYYLTNQDEYVDLVNWAERLRDNASITDPAIISRASDVIGAIRGGNPLIVSQRTSQARLSMPLRYGGSLTDLSGANGISVYYPREDSWSVNTVIWDRYKNNQLFTLTSDSRWDEFLRAGNTALPSPPNPLPETSPPPVLIIPDHAKVYIPLVSK